MLLIREIVRTIRDLLTYAVAARRVAVLLIVVLVVVAVALSATVVTVGPVAVYPFL